MINFSITSPWFELMIKENDFQANGEMIDSDRFQG